MINGLHWYSFIMSKNSKALCAAITDSSLSYTVAVLGQTDRSEAVIQ